MIPVDEVNCHRIENNLTRISDQYQSPALPGNRYCATFQGGVDEGNNPTDTVKGSTIHRRIDGVNLGEVDMKTNGERCPDGIDVFSKSINGKCPSDHSRVPLQNVSDYVLELRNVSYIRSFTTGRWYWKLFNPPVTAQFLKDITLQTHGAEIMGLVGAGGSGKTTLLNVIARRVQGTTSGTITLNHRTMSQRTFQNTCAYVSFKQHLIEHLTVECTLKYQAELALANSVTTTQKEKRVTQMMRDFELVDQAHHKVINISESARRRLLVAMHAIRDPVLLLVDEPCKDIDPLSSYQLMSLLSRYVKKYNRIGVVTMRIPRSDIYPLLDRLTVLFFGEMMYSGYTKMMPQYFRDVGFPCPSTENPAVYFLSLATVDRETSARYIETQQQAVKLIELFKTNGDRYSHAGGNEQENAIVGARSFLPLCHLGRPRCASVLVGLTRRHTVYLTRHWSLLVARIACLPLFSLVLFAFYFQLQPTRTSPQTMAGLIFNCMTSFSTGASVIAAYSVNSLRTRYYQDSWDNLYGGGLFIISYLLATFVLDMVPLFAGTAIVYWGCDLTPNAIQYILFTCALWTCCQFAQLHTLCIMLFVKSPFRAASVVVTLIGIYLTGAGGFLKSLLTYRNSSSEWLHYVTYSNIYRYAGAYLHHQLLSNVSTGCSFVDSRRHSGSPICRWMTGMDYLKEVYHHSDIEHPSMNLFICLIYIAIFTGIVIVVYSLPLPHFIKRKFQYK